MSVANLEWPLAQFNANIADREGVKKIVEALNIALGDDGLSQEVLERSFDQWWPKLNEKLSSALQLSHSTRPANRTDRQLLEELLQLNRAESRRESRFSVAKGEIIVECLGGFLDGEILTKQSQPLNADMVYELTDHGTVGKAFQTATYEGIEALRSKRDRKVEPFTEEELGRFRAKYKLIKRIEGLSTLTLVLENRPF